MRRVISGATARTGSAPSGQPSIRDGVVGGRQAQANGSRARVKGGTRASGRGRDDGALGRVAIVGSAATEAQRRRRLREGKTGAGDDREDLAERGGRAQLPRRRAGADGLGTDGRRDMERERRDQGRSDGAERQP